MCDLGITAATMFGVTLIQLFVKLVSVWRITTMITGREALTCINGEMLVSGSLSRKVSKKNNNVLETNFE